MSGAIPPETLNLSWRADGPHLYYTYTAYYYYILLQNRSSISLNAVYDCTMSIFETQRSESEQKLKFINSNLGMLHPVVFPQLNQKYFSLQTQLQY